LVAAGLAVALVAAVDPAAATAANAAAAATTPVVVPGGQDVAGRLPGKTGTVGVTFGVPGATLNGGPYQSGTNVIYNQPMFKTQPSNLDAFWNEYVEQMLQAGVDFVAFDLRGFLPDRPPPPTGLNTGGDPRLLSGLVKAIVSEGATDKLKIAGLDDTPASLTAEQHIQEHLPDSQPFDMGDQAAIAKYFWAQNEEEFFKQVPDGLRYKIDGRPLMMEWSMNTPSFSDQYGNESKTIRYARSQARAEFGVDPYFDVDQSWVHRDPTVVGQIDAVNNWFLLPAGYSTATFQPIADDSLLTFPAGWSNQGATGRADYSGTLHTTGTVGATVSYDFYGTGVHYLAETNINEGSVDVYVDNQLQSTVALNLSSTLKTQQTVYSKSGLSDGLHTIKIVNKTAAPVNVDGFEVLSDRPASVAGRSFGVVTPGFSVVTGTANMVEDPNHGQTLTTHLQNTVNAGAGVTLVEGMTDWSENAMIARTAEGTYDQRHTDYPNQMLDIMRQFSDDPFPRQMQVEAETADTVTGATPGNNGIYRDGDVDVEAAGDTGGGYDVGGIQGGESLTWQSEPLQGTVDLKVRVATPE
jgi:hypothetical protein